MNTTQATVAQAVTVSLKDFENGKRHPSFPHWYTHLDNTGVVSFDTLTEAFGPSSLGIIIVKDLPPEFVQLRAQVLSNASYLAALSNSELGDALFSQYRDKI